MDTQDIVKSLSKLEHSLQGIESARKQVEDTVTAYGATQKQLAILSQELANVSNAITGLHEDGEKILVGYKQEIDNYLSSFTKLKVELEQGIGLQKDLNAKFLSKIESDHNELRAAISIYASHLKEEGKKNEQNHKELIKSLSAIFQGDSPSTEKLTVRFNAVDGNIGAVKDRVSSVSTQLGTATNQIIDHNKQALLSEVTAIKAENAGIKTLVIFCLVVTILSVVLNVLMLLK